MTVSPLRFSLGKLESLPAMPEIAHRLLALPLDTEAGEAQMLSLIEQDPQIYARVIGLANSPAIGSGRKITRIRDAAMLLGMKRLKSVVIGIATMSKMLSQPAGKNFDPHDLWTHSMTVAIVMNVVAQAMPKRIRPDDNQIFLAGLLHDIGLMALHYLDPEASDELHRQLRLQPKCPIQALELELLGVTHSYIGAQLVRHWHLPDEIVDVVQMHHAPVEGEDAYANPLVRLVCVAEKLLPDFGVAEHTIEAVDQNEWRELCIAPERAAEFYELANELALQVVQLPDTYGAPKRVEAENVPAISDRQDAPRSEAPAVAIVNKQGLLTRLAEFFRRIARLFR